MLMAKEINVAYGFMESHFNQAFPLNTLGLDSCKELALGACSYANFLFLETTELLI